MIRRCLRLGALALLALPTAAPARQAADPALVAEAAALATPAPLPSIRMIGDRIYAELPAAPGMPARWAFSPIDPWLRGKPIWTTALDLTPPAGETTWRLAAVHCLGPAQARCLIQPGPGDGRTTLLEYDVAANRIVADGFAAPLARRDLDWQDQDHVLVTAADADGGLRRLLRWQRGTPLAAATPWFALADSAGGGVWPSRLSDTIGSRITVIAQDMGNGRRRMWVEQEGRIVPLALPDSAWVSGLVQGQLVVTTGDAGWAAGGMPAQSVAVLPIAELTRARPRLRLLFTATASQRLEGASVARSSLYVSWRDRARGRLSSFAWRYGRWTASPARLPQHSALAFAASNDAHDYALVTEQGYGGARRWLVAPGAARRVGEQAQTVALAVRQFVAKASDGNALPYFVLARPDARSDAPVLVTGYGAWGETRGPAPLGRFEQLWIRRGGILVDAIVRGGGEFGEAWHRAATGVRRSVGFADFNTIADDLVARGLAREGRMGLVGSDNFGLLALDAVARRPGRWRALWLSDPIADLEHAATLGVAESDRAALAAEYGDPADPAVATALAAANPLRRLGAGGDWPAILVQHAQTDPWNRGAHSAALAAALRTAGRSARVEATPGDYDQWRDSPERAAIGFQFLTGAGLDPVAAGSRRSPGDE